MASKIFEAGDVLPATTQLRITWDSVLSWFSDLWGSNDFLKVGTDTYFNAEGYSTEGWLYCGLIGDNIWHWASGWTSPYTGADGDHNYIDIDTSSLTPTERTVTQVDWYFENYTWEDLAPAPSGYTITFEENGGSTVTDLTEQTALPTPLPIPTRPGYTFLGWYYDSDFTNEAFADDPLTGDVTLYAKWHSLGDYVEVEGGVLLNVYSGSESNVIIPETYYDKAVVGIGADAFRNNTNIESIILPSSISAIGNNAFNGCSNLKRVRINAITPPTLGTTPFINNHEDLEIVVSIAALLSYKQSWTSYSSIIKSVYSTDLNEIRKEKLALKQLLMEKGLYDEGMDFSKYHIKLQEYLSRANYVIKIKENPDGSQDVEFIPISGELQAYNGPTTIVEDQVIPCAGKYMEHDIIVEVFDEEEMNERLDAIIARLNDIVGV